MLNGFGTIPVLNQVAPGILTPYVPISPGFPDITVFPPGPIAALLHARNQIAAVLHPVAMPAINSLDSSESERQLVTVQVDADACPAAEKPAADESIASLVEHATAGVTRELRQLTGVDARAERVAAREAHQAKRQQAKADRKAARKAAREARAAAKDAA